MNGKFCLGLFFLMKKTVAGLNFLDSFSLLMMTLPIEVKPRFLRSTVMVSHGLLALVFFPEPPFAVD